MKPRQRHHISTGWKWRLANSNGNNTADNIKMLQQWTPVKAFPSVIHSELLDRKIIPDFKVGENERKIQWVGEADWAYSSTFTSPEELGSSSGLRSCLTGNNRHYGGGPVCLCEGEVNEVVLQGRGCELAD